MSPIFYRRQHPIATLLTNRANPKLQKIGMLPQTLLPAAFVGVAAAGPELGVAVAPSCIQPDRRLSVGIETLLVRAAEPEKEIELVLI